MGEVMGKKVFDKTMLRFLLVGVINTLVGTTVMFVGYNLLHLGYWVSSAANYVVGSVVSYVLNRTFTFQSKTKGAGEAMRFIVNISVCYLIAYGMAKPAIKMLLSGSAVEIQENLAMLCGMGLFVVLNYFGQRYFVFRPAQQEETTPS